MDRLKAVRPPGGLIREEGFMVSAPFSHCQVLSGVQAEAAMTLLSIPVPIG